MISRRIVTNGKEFRIQLRFHNEADWGFYPTIFPTFKEAKLKMDEWNKQDKSKIEDEWKVVE